MEANTLFLLLGLLMLFIGVFGGGFQFKELKMPRVSTASRVLGFVIGIFLILLSQGVLTNFLPQFATNPKVNKKPGSVKLPPEDAPSEQGETQDKYERLKENNTNKGRSAADRQIEPVEATTASASPTPCTTGNCEQGNYTYVMHLISSDQKSIGMLVCTYSVKVVNVDCCNLVKVVLSGSGKTPSAASIERTDSSKDVKAQFNQFNSGWRIVSNALACGGLLGCGNGTYTATIEFTNDNECPTTIELTLQLT